MVISALWRLLNGSAERKAAAMHPSNSDPVPSSVGYGPIGRSGKRRTSLIRPLASIHPDDRMDFTLTRMQQ